ncbi:hypothetical protein D8674_021362 [Pyrus ussuriensis x Pyrus communis]|uniref:Uncharacterized protein n=1 Tax=Pyrus ussuriensis x Pyrus communis TaxID=2448454 RepID=A0A5N5GVJ0_9ROSA|nr:hypothetical protein D8674_021362 [Pyrus ussuriensis x Pyrus communis]
MKMVSYKLAMPKELVHRRNPWIEVAPPLLDFPWKGSSSPKLETILEERVEEYNDDDD